MRYVCSCWTILTLLVCLLGARDCYAQDQELRTFPSAEGDREVWIERGKPRPVLDGVGWVLGVPAKIMLWDRRASNHDVSRHTETKAINYLADHRHSNGVMLRVNQYDPWGEWRRLSKNKRIAPGWRYTVGGVYTLAYTIAPGRLFGGDWYNPYTDTMHLYSDIPSLAMEQAAYAEDIHGRDNPGTYASVQALPFAGLWHETSNKKSVYEYVDATGGLGERREARLVLEPQLGSEVGGQFGSVLPGGVLWEFAGAAVGQVTGRFKARRLQDYPAEFSGAVEPQPVVRAQSEAEKKGRLFRRPSWLPFRRQESTPREARENTGKKSHEARRLSTFR